MCMNQPDSVTHWKFCAVLKCHMAYRLQVLERFSISTEPASNYAVLLGNSIALYAAPVVEFFCGLWVKRIQMAREFNELLA